MSAGRSLVDTMKLGMTSSWPKLNMKLLMKTVKKCEYQLSLIMNLDAMRTEQRRRKDPLRTDMMDQPISNDAGWESRVTFIWNVYVQSGKTLFCPKDYGVWSTRVLHYPTVRLWRELSVEEEKRTEKQIPTKNRWLRKFSSCSSVPKAFPAFPIFRIKHTYM